MFNLNVLWFNLLFSLLGGFVYFCIPILIDNEFIPSIFNSIYKCLSAIGNFCIVFSEPYTFAVLNEDTDVAEERHRVLKSYLPDNSMVIILLTQNK